MEETEARLSNFTKIELVEKQKHKLDLSVPSSFYIIKLINNSVDLFGLKF